MQEKSIKSAKLVLIIWLCTYLNPYAVCLWNVGKIVCVENAV